MIIRETDEMPCKIMVTKAPSRDCWYRTKVDLILRVVDDGMGYFYAFDATTGRKLYVNYNDAIFIEEVL